MEIDSLRALVFDVFGTVVDWRTSITEEGRALGRRKSINVDWGRFADAWRGKYQPSMDRVRRGERAWVRLDDLHRESLMEVLSEFGIEGLTESEIDHLNRAWHRLRPWSDSVAGLSRMKRKFILGTLSNGNVALLVNMAKFSELPWDVILGAEPARAYKPLPEAYIRTCEILDLPPAQVMLVAAHNGDLQHACSHGMRTAFVARPMEHGPGQTKDLEAEHEFDFVAADFFGSCRTAGVLAIALLVMTGFQSIQLSRERDLMRTRIVQQEEPLKESETVRKQWDGIRAGTIELAQQGNENAKRIVERLLKTGLLRVKAKEETE